jgi:hypothetical protein
VIEWRLGTLAEVAALLTVKHYLGPVKAGGAQAVVVGAVDGQVVAAQVWRRPTSRRLPADGTWLELSRWCLTPEAGADAGSRMHAQAVKLLRLNFGVGTLVSYSDPSQGHTGALYRACNWRWAPTWHRLRPPPTGQGNWGTDQVQHVKDRWVFPIGHDPRRQDILMVNDGGAIRRWLASNPGPAAIAVAQRSMATDLVIATRGLS